MIKKKKTLLMALIVASSSMAAVSCKKVCDLDSTSTSTSSSTSSSSSTDVKDLDTLYNAAKSFGYTGDYASYVKDYTSGTLSAQYSVKHSADYSSFTYGFDEKKVTLSAHSILVDSRFTDAEVSSHSYIYNSINKAIEAAVDGSATESMDIYVAPGVYWTHDPASESTDNAYQIEKTCSYMNWIGLSDDYRNVVIAFNYGHDEGYAGGNPTCFNISGDNFSIKNMTIGGYCNVDLTFPLNTSLNREKRSTNVTQCQLGNFNGDKLYCDNVSFVSRLNMMPFVSSKRALYKDCHMESTDDALNGSAKSVYLNCDFDFYASKPWYSSSGSTLLNCDFNITHINTSTTGTNYQYLSKAESKYTVIDSRYYASGDYTIDFTDVMSDTFKSYYSNVTLNGEQIDYNGHGTDLTGTDALSAYKVTDSNGKTVYNIYNLLKGDDDWDPLSQKEMITQLSKNDLPTDITLEAENDVYTIQSNNATTSNVDTTTLKCSVVGSSTYQTDIISYSVSNPDDSNDDLSDAVTLTKNADGSCTVKAITDRLTTINVIVTATDKSGLVAKTKLEVKPFLSQIAAAVINNVVIDTSAATASVKYSYSSFTPTGVIDQTKIDWYLSDTSTERDTSNMIHIATTKVDGKSCKSIPLNSFYSNKYLYVGVQLKHSRSEYASTTYSMSDQIGTIAATTSYTLNNDQFIKIVTDNNITSDSFAAKAGFWYANNVSYGTGNKNGFKDKTGLYFTGNKSTTPAFSELYYLTSDSNVKNMSTTLKVAPGKTAGQGFGSNNNFIEVRLKYDHQTKTGYSMRIVRTSGDSTKVQLGKIENGTFTVLTESENTSAYLSDCTITFKVENNKLTVSVSSSAEQPATAVEKGYLKQVTLEHTLDSDTLTSGGFGLYYESSTGDNTTYITEMSFNWTLA